MSNYYTATFPESFFIMMRMCTIPTREGRITLTDAHLKIVKNGDISESEIKNEEEFSRHLKEYFGLDLGSIKEFREDPIKSTASRSGETQLAVIRFCAFEKEIL